MKESSEAELLRVFIGESDRHGHRPLYEVIVERARERGLAGATVFRGITGFGKHSRIHTVKIFRLSEDLPIVIEIVDKPERINAFLPELDAMIELGLDGLQPIQVTAEGMDPAMLKRSFGEQLTFMVSVPWDACDQTAFRARLLAAIGMARACGPRSPHVRGLA